MKHEDLFNKEFILETLGLDPQNSLIIVEYSDSVPLLSEKYCSASINRLQL